MAWLHVTNGFLHSSLRLCFTSTWAIHDKNAAFSFISSGEMNAGADVEDPAKAMKGRLLKKLNRG